MAVAPTARLTVSFIEPVPLAAHVAPAEAAQVHVAPVSSAVSVSVIGVPLAIDGPLFNATMV